MSTWMLCSLTSFSSPKRPLLKRIAALPDRRLALGRRDDRRIGWQQAAQLREGRLVITEVIGAFVIKLPLQPSHLRDIENLQPVHEALLAQCFDVIDEEHRHEGHRAGQLTQALLE